MKKIAGWGNFPQINATVLEPVDRVGVQAYVLENERIIARGNGRSYGDASLAPTVLSILRLNRLLHFDAQHGVVECEAGMLFSELLKIIVPAGWFFAVTPGTKQITVGGAIASDVHGKNHPTAGCFSNCLISFELMGIDGGITTCSRTENAELFWQTCGGMGWTGVVLSAKFSLIRIPSAQMRQRTQKAKNLEGIFRAFEENQSWPYVAAWLDGTSAQWRGAAFFAAHSPSENVGFVERARLNIPFYAPGCLLNSWSIRAYNALVFNTNSNGERLIGLDQYFYPLDRLQHWNRLYGRRGLVQYQFCLPEKNAVEGMAKVRELTRKSPETPFLTVLKRHGERPPEAVNSFPIKGYSLALDFPRTRGIFDLIKKLDALVWALEGKIYLTKDACSAPHMSRVDAGNFGAPKFSSLLRERISRDV